MDIGSYARGKYLMTLTTTVTAKMVKTTQMEKETIGMVIELNVEMNPLFIKKVCSEFS